MILRRDSASRRDSPGTGPSSVPEVGRALRRERTRRGLRMEDVALRTALPLEQLEALEGGTVDRLPDRVGILKTLRRYAEFLGLPGDRYVLILVDHWPAVATGVAPSVVALHSGAAVLGAGVPPTAAVYPPGSAETAAVPAVAPVAGATPAGLATDAVTGAATGSVAAGGALFAGPATAPVLMPAADTGVSPAVPRRAPAQRVRRVRRAPPVLLRLLVVLVALLVLVGAAGLIVNHYRPQWIHDLGINRPAGSTGGSAAPAGAAPTTAPPAHTTTPRAPALLTQTSASNTSADFVVHAGHFQVAVTAVGGACWVQVNGPEQVTPLFAGVLAQGQTQHFRVQQALTMELGAKAGHVLVGTNRTLLGVYVPSVAPFTLTYRTAP